MWRRLMIFVCVWKPVNIKSAYFALFWKVEVREVAGKKDGPGFS